MIGSHYWQQNSRKSIILLYPVFDRRIQHACCLSEGRRYFNALQYTSYENTKVVILGQDPYHGPNQAHGLSFSVQPGVKTPPSLLNMYKELRDEYGYEIPNNGYLVKWAEQGVLLLNTVLTVRQGEANSHKGKGWEHFTDRVIELLNEREKPVIFILWGAMRRRRRS